jgi:DNA-binding NarL/FixJ family response regulator
MATARVLLVDDEAVMREALRELLLEEGLDVVGEAPNGRIACELALALEADVVLMDMRMPEMDGLEATRIIKDRSPSTRVIVLTAYEDPSLKEQAAQAGADAYIVKGTLAADILRTIAELHPDGC